jgi:CheY-like chemotaxis protein
MPPRLLIVDDDPGFRRLARTLLGVAFDVVAEAGSAEEARQAVRRAVPDLVLLDVHLPDGDGFDLARDLTTPGAAALQVILTSSADLDGYAEAIADSGAKGFVPKAELDQATLLRLLRGE